MSLDKNKNNDVPGFSGTSKNKKRKADKQLVNLTYGVKTSNSFEPLSDCDSMSEDEIVSKIAKTNAKAKIPPVVIYGNISYDTISLLKSKLTGDITFKYKGNRSDIYTNNMSDYNKVMNFAKESEYEHYTFTPKENREIKLLLKNISPHIKPEEIEEDLTKHNIKISRITQMIKKLENQTELKLPIFVINFSPTINKNDVFCIKSVCNCLVKWEYYKNSNIIVQCFKCQGYGHVSKNCFKKPKCIKCSKSHYSSLCTIVSDSEIKCANCGGNHRANDRSCEVYNKITQLRSTRNSRLQAESSAPDLNVKNFPYLKSKSISTETSYRDKVKTNTTSITYQADKQETCSNSFGDVISEIKNLFSFINFSKLKDILLRTTRKMTTTTDAISKLGYLVEGIVELFDEP